MTEQTPKTSGTGKSAPRMRPWLRVVLVVSLALNLAVVGIVAGTAFNHERRPPPRPPRLDQIAGPLTFALTEEDRKAIGKEIFAEYRKQGRPSREAIREEYQGVIDALRTTPFDPTAVEQSLERQRVVANERAELGHRLLVQHLSDLTEADRAAFADRLEEGLNRFREGRPPPRDRDGRLPLKHR
ncbi:periplasmic heavy metal sensor [Pseudooceanicola nanhaiensis]|uniref:periplasmic heavy metal sensor n=1 Tax=Pseudooceanicola nanhaiensis TaxID=375761 RepID=UPI001CD3B880|nr:periplasmic heavy metal sensor [Pseudooceanicola nanhaiensis]MCA0920113.1 periplasmic heavy metal sensor [Pseudooceanicola nanhaiensis]